MHEELRRVEIAESLSLKDAATEAFKAQDYGKAVDDLTVLEVADFDSVGISQRQREAMLARVQGGELELQPEPEPELAREPELEPGPEMPSRSYSPVYMPHKRGQRRLYEPYVASPPESWICSGRRAGSAAAGPPGWCTWGGFLRPVSVLYWFGDETV